MTHVRAKEDEMPEKKEHQPLPATAGRVWSAVRERKAVVAFGRAWVERKCESAFSTAHLANFLDAVERGEHQWETV